MRSTRASANGDSSKAIILSPTELNSGLPAMGGGVLTVVVEVNNGVSESPRLEDEGLQQELSLREIGQPGGTDHSTIAPSDARETVM